MSEEITVENEMGNIVSGSKDILSSLVHRPEGVEEEKAGEVLSGETEQSDKTESESIPEWSTSDDKQQSTGDREDKDIGDTKSTSTELQYNRSTECDGSGRGDRDSEQQQQQQQRGGEQHQQQCQQCEQCGKCDECEQLFWEIIKRQQEAWDKYTSTDKEGEGDVIIDENTCSFINDLDNDSEDETDDEQLSIVSTFIIHPNAFKLKDRDNKKKNKSKKWFRNKKVRKGNGKIQYIIF